MKVCLLNIPRLFVCGHVSVVPVVPGEGVGVEIECEEGSCRGGEGWEEGEGGWDEEEVGTWSTVVEGKSGMGERGEGERGEMTTHIRGNEQHLEKNPKKLCKVWTLM